MTRTRRLATALAALTAAATLPAAALQPSAQPPSPPSDQSLQRTARPMDPIPLGVGRLIPDLALVPLSGDATTLTAILKGKRGVVIAMTSVGCPAAMKYIPRLAKLEDEFAASNIPFVYVNAERAETDPDMRRVVSDQRLEGPYLPDRDASVVTALHARTTTEVFVIDASRTLLFRGAVDDQYGIGSSLPAPRNNFLKDALAALLANSKPTIRATWPPGCVLDLPAESQNNAAAETPTYHAHIARIIEEHCAACHTPSGAAGTGGPFALNSFTDLIARAPMVEAVVRDRIMPPFQGVQREGSNPSPWAHDRSMTDADRQRLLTWLRSDRPMGNTPDALAANPAEAPAPSSAWAIGVPDLILTTPAIKVPADGPLKHHRVYLATPLVDPSAPPPPAQPITAFSALEFKPIEPKAFHHAVIWIMEPGTPLPKPTDLPTSLQLLGTYSRGDALLRLNNRSRAIAPGSVLVADLYLTPMGKEMNAALRLGFKQTSPNPTTNSPIRSIVLSQPDLNLPPNTSDASATATLTLTSNTTITALTPILGPRAVAIRIEALTPDGSTIPLLDAPRFEWRWAIRFERLEPITLPAGTLINATATFDTTEANPNNPTPSAQTSSGPRETDEHLVVVLEALQL